MKTEALVTRVSRDETVSSISIRENCGKIVGVSLLGSEYFQVSTKVVDRRVVLRELGGNRTLVFMFSDKWYLVHGGLQREVVYGYTLLSSVFDFLVV